MAIEVQEQRKNDHDLHSEIVIFEYYSGTENSLSPKHLQMSVLLLQFERFLKSDIIAMSVVELPP